MLRRRRPWLPACRLQGACHAGVARVPLLNHDWEGAGAAHHAPHPGAPVAAAVALELPARTAHHAAPGAPAAAAAGAAVNARRFTEGLRRMLCCCMRVLVTIGDEMKSTHSPTAKSAKAPGGGTDWCRRISGKKGGRYCMDHMLGSAPAGSRKRGEHRLRHEGLGRMSPYTSVGNPWKSS